MYISVLYTLLKLSWVLVVVHPSRQDPSSAQVEYLSHHDFLTDLSQIFTHVFLLSNAKLMPRCHGVLVPDLSSLSSER